MLFKGNVALDVWCPNKDGNPKWLNQVDIWNVKRKEFVIGNNPFYACSHLWLRQTLKIGVFCLPPFMMCPRPASGDPFGGVGVKLLEAVGKDFHYNLEYHVEFHQFYSPGSSSQIGGVSKHAFNKNECQTIWNILVDHYLNQQAKKLCSYSV